MKHRIMVLSEKLQDCRFAMYKIREIDEDIVFNHSHNQRIEETENIIYFLETASNENSLRGREVDQVIYVGEKHLFEILHKAVGTRMQDMTRRSCVPDEYKIQKWEYQ